MEAPTAMVLGVLRVALERADMAATGFKPHEIEAAKKWLRGVPRPDLDTRGHEKHWQRPDGSVYAVDSSD